jgi:transposase InsO family protein
MVGPARKRAAVRRAVRELGFPERRVCRALGVPRSTLRYVGKVGAFARRLFSRILEFVRKFPRFGYRRVFALLRREGWRVNHKRIERLWRQQGLRVPFRQHKSRRLGSSENGCIRRRATKRNDVWTLDFAFDVTEDGRTLKFLAVVDEFTREAHGLIVDRSIKAVGVLDLLERLFREHGIPAHLRCDNGPEFLAEVLRAWLARRGVEILFIEPGSPWENGYGESFIGRLRDELLDRELFTSLLEAQVVTEDWRVEYNESRPHGALGYETPKAFAAACARAADGPIQETGHEAITVPALT